MLDIKFIRQNLKKIKEGCIQKGIKVDIDRLLEIDEKRRKKLKIIEDLKAQKNKASKEIARTKDKTKTSIIDFFMISPLITSSCEILEFCFCHRWQEVKPYNCANM